MEHIRWLRTKVLIVLMIAKISHNFQIRDKWLIPHRKLQSNASKHQHVVTEEETTDTFFIPQPPALLPNYPVAIITQPAVQVDTPKEHKHEHTHGHEHKNVHENEHVYQPKHGKEHVDENEHVYQPKHGKEHVDENKHGQEKTSRSEGSEGSKSHRAIGCYKDAIPRAVPSLEGSDSILKDFYKTRDNAVDECARVAKARGYEIFTIQNGGFCSSGPNAHSTFQIYGPAENCKNGRGGKWASDVYIFNDYIYELTIHTGMEQKSSTNAKVSVTLYGSLGSSRNIDLRSEGSTNDPFQSGQVDKFLVHTIPLGDLVRLHICHDNTGPQPHWYLEKVSIKDPKNKIYIFPCNCWLKHDKSEKQSERNLFPASVLNPGSIKYLGCYRERHKDRVIQANVIKEDEILDGHPSNDINKRVYVLEKCAHMARQRGYLFFEIHNGLDCSTSSIVQDTYDMYGPAVNCHKNGAKGGVWTKTVYTFPDQEPPSSSTTEREMD